MKISEYKIILNWKYLITSWIICTYIVTKIISLVLNKLYKLYISKIFYFICCQIYWQKVVHDTFLLSISVSTLFVLHQHPHFWYWKWCLLPFFWYFGLKYQYYWGTNIEVTILLVFSRSIFLYWLLSVVVMFLISLIFNSSLLFFISAYFECIYCFASVH